MERFNKGERLTASKLNQLYDKIDVNGRGGSTLTYNPWSHINTKALEKVDDDFEEANIHLTLNECVGSALISVDGDPVLFEFLSYIYNEAEDATFCLLNADRQNTTEFYKHITYDRSAGFQKHYFMHRYNGHLYDQDAIFRAIDGEITASLDDSTFYPAFSIEQEGTYDPENGLSTPPLKITNHIDEPTKIDRPFDLLLEVNVTSSPNPPYTYTLSSAYSFSVLSGKIKTKYGEWVTMPSNFLAASMNVGDLFRIYIERTESAAENSGYQMVGESGKMDEVLIRDDIYPLYEIHLLQDPETGQKLPNVVAYFGGSDIIVGEDPPPFYPKRILEDPEGEDPFNLPYKVRLQRGVVFDRLTDKSVTDDLLAIIPKIDVDGTYEDMDHEDAILEVSIDEWVYCKYSTDEYGVVKTSEPDFPTIVTSPSEEASTHYQPADELHMGQEGVYWVKLFKLVEGDNPDSGYINAEVYQQSDIEHHHELPTFDNIGSGLRVFKQRVFDEYEFLSVDGTVDTEPSTSGTVELDTMVEYVDDAGDTQEDLADATAIKVRAFLDGADIEATHPWKVTPNGDNTVAVEAGKVLSFDNESVTTAGSFPAFIHLKEFFNYAGGNVTVTGAGKIYASMPFVEGAAASVFDLDPGTGADDGYTAPLVPDTTGALTVGFAATLPNTGDVMVFEIADVSLNASVAVVDDQIITHNPQMVAWTTSGPGSP